MCYEWRRRRTFRLFAGVVMLVPIVLVEQPGTAQTGHRSHRGVSRPDKKKMLFLNIIDNKSRGENNRGIASCDIIQSNTQRGPEVLSGRTRSTPVGRIIGLKRSNWVAIQSRPDSRRGKFIGQIHCYNHNNTSLQMWM